MPITSESENDESEKHSDVEQQPFSDEEQETSPAVTRPPPSIIKERYSDSSSDNSSGNTSDSKGKKKSKHGRTSDKALADVQNLTIKQEAIQHQNKAQFNAILESHLDIKSMVKSVQADLKTVTSSVKSVQADLKTVTSNVNDLSAKSDSSQTTINTMQEGIVANTTKILSESEIAKQNIVMIEKRFDMLAEQKKEDSIPPTQPEPTVQSLDSEDKEIVKLEDNASLNVVLKRESKDSQYAEKAQLSLIHI